MLFRATEIKGFVFVLKVKDSRNIRPELYEKNKSDVSFRGGSFSYLGGMEGYVFVKNTVQETIKNNLFMI